MSLDIFCHSSIIKMSHTNFDLPFSLFCKALSVIIINAVSLSYWNFFTVSSQPFKIDKRLFNMITLLASLCLQISKAHMVLPLPPRASRKIPFVSQSHLLIASLCHFLNLIVIAYHHLSDVMNDFFNVISHCPKQSQSCCSPHIIVMAFIKFP